MTDPNLEALERAAALVTRLRRRYSGTYPTRHALAWRAPARVARGLQLYLFWLRPLNEGFAAALERRDALETGRTPSDRPNLSNPRRMHAPGGAAPNVHGWHEFETSDPRHVDDPELDATDGAHPAWWRGHDHLAAKLRSLAGLPPHAPLGELANAFRQARAADVVTEREADIYRRGYEAGRRRPLGALRRLLGALANDEIGDETRVADRAARELVDAIDDLAARGARLMPSREDIDGPSPVTPQPGTTERAAAPPELVLDRYAEKTNNPVPTPRPVRDPRGARLGWCIDLGGMPIGLGEAHDGVYPTPAAARAAAAAVAVGAVPETSET